MAAPGAVISQIADLTGTNESKVRNLYDELRKSGDAPVGVRGRYGVNVNTETAAKLLIAVCCAEHVKDAPDAVRRYSDLQGNHGFKYHDSNMPLTGLGWGDIAAEFPRLAELQAGQSFLTSLTALIDSYIDAPERDERTSITFGSPYPWAKASVMLQSHGASRHIALEYTTPVYGDDDGRGYEDPDFLALVDPSKERQRRRFAKLGGDLRLTMSITDRTLAELGALLREK